MKVSMTADELADWILKLWGPLSALEFPLTAPRWVPPMVLQKAPEKVLQMALRKAPQILW